MTPARKKQVYWSDEKCATAKRLFEDGASVNEIARVCDVSRRSAQRIIAKLQNGQIVGETATKAGRKKSSRDDLIIEINYNSYCAEIGTQGYN